MKKEIGDIGKLEAEAKALAAEISGEIREEAGDLKTVEEMFRSTIIYIDKIVQLTKTFFQQAYSIIKILGNPYHYWYKNSKAIKEYIKLAINQLRKDLKEHIADLDKITETVSRMDPVTDKLADTIKANLEQVKTIFGEELLEVKGLEKLAKDLEAIDVGEQKRILHELLEEVNTDMESLGMRSVENPEEAERLGEKWEARKRYIERARRGVQGVEELMSKIREALEKLRKELKGVEGEVRAVEEKFNAAEKRLLEEIIPKLKGNKDIESRMISAIEGLKRSLESDLKEVVTGEYIQALNKPTVGPVEALRILWRGVSEVSGEMSKSLVEYSKVVGEMEAEVDEVIRSVSETVEELGGSFGFLEKIGKAVGSVEEELEGIDKEFERLIKRLEGVAGGEARDRKAREVILALTESVKALKESYGELVKGLRLKKEELEEMPKLVKELTQIKTETDHSLRPFKNEFKSIKERYQFLSQEVRKLEPLVSRKVAEALKYVKEARAILEEYIKGKTGRAAAR